MQALCQSAIQTLIIYFSISYDLFAGGHTRRKSGVPASLAERGRQASEN
jgi:hypothetical protein